MPNSFVFTFPEPILLQDDDLTFEPKEILFESSSFFYIAKKIVDSVHSLLISSEERCSLISVLSYIEKNLQILTMSSLIPAEYQKLINDKKNTQIFLSIIMLTRNSTIKITKKTDLQTPEFAIQILDENYKRLCVMTVFAKIISESTIVPRYFLQAIFSDANNSLYNISTGLYLQYYTDQYKKLIHLFLQTNFLTEKLRESFLSSLIDKSDPDSICFSSYMLQCNSQLFLYNIQYYFALGNDEKAYSLLDEETFIKVANQKVLPLIQDTTKEIFPDYFEKVLKISKKLKAEIKDNPTNTRAAYAKIFSYISKIPSNRVDSSNVNINITNKNQLKKMLELNLTSTKKLDHLSFASTPIIEACILSLDTAHCYNYNQNIKIKKICEDIIITLQKIIQKNKGSVIGFKICESLNIYLKEIAPHFYDKKTAIQLKDADTLTTQIERNFLEPSEEKKTQPILEVRPLQKKKSNKKSICARTLSSHEIQSQLSQVQKEITEQDKEIASLKIRNIKLKTEHLEEEKIITEKIQNNLKKIQELKMENSSVTKKLSTTELELKKYTSQINISKQKKQKLKAERISQEEKLEKIIQKIDQLEKEKTVLEQQHEKLAIFTPALLFNKKSEAAQLKSSHEMALHTLKTAAQTYKQKSAIRAQASDQVTKKINKVVEDNTAIRVETENIIQISKLEIAKLQKETILLNKEIENFQKKNSQLYSGSAQLKQIITQLHNDHEKTQQLNDQLFQTQIRFIEETYEGYKAIIEKLKFQSITHRIPTVVYPPNSKIIHSQHPANPIKP